MVVVGDSIPDVSDESHVVAWSFEPTFFVGQRLGCRSCCRCDESAATGKCICPGERPWAFFPTSRAVLLCPYRQVGLEVETTTHPKLDVSADIRLIDVERESQSSLMLRAVEGYISTHDRLPHVVQELAVPLLFTARHVVRYLRTHRELFSELQLACPHYHSGRTTSPRGPTLRVVDYRLARQL